MPSFPIIPWPDHWHYNEHSIKCLAKGCQFTTQSNGLARQFGDLETHCKESPGAEHKILLCMLGQRKCAICDFRIRQGDSSSNKTRKLFAHERAVHGSDSMSRICEFITLVRESGIEGRLGRVSQPIAFERMVEKLQGFEQPVTHLLCQKYGLPHTPENLQQVLSPDHLRPDGDSTPIWSPVCPEGFLYHLRPNENDPADYQWGRVWTRLRQMYRSGYL